MNKSVTKKRLISWMAEIQNVIVYCCLDILQMSESATGSPLRTSGLGFCFNPLGNLFVVLLTMLC